MKRRKKHRAITPEMQALRDAYYTRLPDQKDKRWNRKCNYCMVALRKHYSYDHARRNGLCPHCHRTETKEKKVEDSMELETCPIKRPEPREVGKLRRVLVSGRQARPFVDAKWSTLKEWAEHLRDRHERKGEFLTIGGLLNLAYRAAPNYDKGVKAANRIKALYREEWDQFIVGIQSTIEDSLRREREAEEKRRKLLDEKQKVRATNDHSAIEQRILDVLGRFGMDKADIRAETGLRKVNKPLKRLVKRGLVIVKNGEYLLPRKKKLKKTGGKSRV